MKLVEDGYLMENEPAKVLYSEIKNLPIIDLHNHGNVKQIIKNSGWNNIWEIEGENDHYVWELMRNKRVPEEKITGEASDKEKWLALAEIFPCLVGNPTYEWIHIDLKNRFDINKKISKYTAEYIWKKTRTKLEKNHMKPQKLLQEMNVEVMCTTDSPTSRLDYHKKARKLIDKPDIYPTWRIDRAFNIGNKNWNKFILDLEKRTNRDLNTLEDFIVGLKKTHDYFAELGCISSDVSLNIPFSYEVDKSHIQKIYIKGLNKKEISYKEKTDFKAYMLNLMGEFNKEKNWLTQLHIGAVRDYRTDLYEKLGEDAGGDICSDNIEIVNKLKYFLNRFDPDLEIVLYYLNPILLPTMATIARIYPNVSVGAPWWFNDNIYGIREYLQIMANVNLLMDIPGMVTDSQKIMSYDSRTEIFRRVLSNFIGKMVKRNQISFKTAYDILVQICYQNSKNKLYRKEFGKCP